MRAVAGSHVPDAGGGGLVGAVPPWGAPAWGGPTGTKRRAGAACQRGLLVEPLRPEAACGWALGVGGGRGGNSVWNW